MISYQSLVFNGKFLAQPITGVQRYALEIIVSVDQLLSSGEWKSLIPFELAIPVERVQNLPTLKVIKIRHIPSVELHLWEQVSLLKGTRKDILVNLTGSAPLLKKSQICTFHDAAIFDVPESYGFLFRFWYKFLFRIQARICLRILTVSNFSRDRLSFHLKIPKSKIGIVQNGANHLTKINPNIFIIDKYKLIPKSYYLIVGSANPSKNIKRLIEAFISIKNMDAQLVIVGEINKKVFASSHLDELESDPRIVNVGRVDDMGLKSLYQNARAFLFPSLYEGFGIPPLEAMACVCPVLASNIASIVEVCHEAAGYFNPNSTASICDALKKSLNDSIWLNNLRTAGFARAQMFNWENAAESLLAEFADLGLVCKV